MLKALLKLAVCFGVIVTPLRAQAQVASIAVTFGTNTVATGNTTQATAKGRNSSGGNVSVSCAWSTVGSAASVSASGVVTGAAPGVAAVVCRSGAITGSRDITDTARTAAPPAALPGTPGRPTLTVTSGVTTSSLRASWTAPTSGGTVASYIVTSNFPTQTTSVQTVTFASVPNGSTQWACVQSANSAGTSDMACNSTTIPASAPVDTTTPPDTTTKPPVDTTTTPPPTTGAPQPAGGDVILWQDNFDARTNFSGYATAGAMSLITGRGNAGKAARFSYSTSSDDNLIEKGFPAATDVYFRYWYRVSAGWYPYGGRTGSGMKWFMPWRSSDPRYTCGVGQLTTPNWQFTCHDNSSPNQPNPFGQNKSATPNFATTNDGQWHEYVLHIVVGSAGYEQIWIDGVKVLDDSGLGYTHSSQGISVVQFPGLVVDGIPSSAWAGTVDIDDFVIWRKP